MIEHVAQIVERRSTNALNSDDWKRVAVVRGKNIGVLMYVLLCLPKQLILPIFFLCLERTWPVRLDEMSAVCFHTLDNIKASGSIPIIERRTVHLILMIHSSRSAVKCSK